MGSPGGFQEVLELGEEHPTAPHAAAKSVASTLSLLNSPSRRDNNDDTSEKTSGEDDTAADRLALDLSGDHSGKDKDNTDDDNLALDLSGKPRTKDTADGEHLALDRSEKLRGKDSADDHPALDLSGKPFSEDNAVGFKELSDLKDELPDPPPVPEKSVHYALSLFKTPSGRDDDDDTFEKPSAGKVTTNDPLALDLSGKPRAKDTAAVDISVPKRFPADALDHGEGERAKRLALMEGGGAASGTGFSARGWWVSNDDNDAVQLKVAMQGLGKEHVKVSAENILVIKGEGDGDDQAAPARYNHRFELPAETFKMDQIKAEMNNGVLKVTLPKIKDEERKNVFQIKVE